MVHLYIYYILANEFLMALAIKGHEMTIGFSVSVSFEQVFIISMGPIQPIVDFPREHKSREQTISTVVQ